MRRKKEILSAVYVRGLEKTTVSEMLYAFCGKLDIELHNLHKLEGYMKEYGLECYPALTEGDWDKERILTHNKPPKIDIDKIKLQLKEPENRKLEFKSSLLYNYNQARAQPNVDPIELSHEPIIHSVLKTICAFLNSYGGELFIGVNDEGEPLGIEVDFNCDKKISNYDNWLNFFKNTVKTNFHSRESILHYMKFDLIRIDDFTICKVKTAKSTKLQFLKEKRGSKTYKSYYRTNGSTEEIHIQDLPEYLEGRKI